MLPEIKTDNRITVFFNLIAKISVFTKCQSFFKYKIIFKTNLHWQI